VDVLQDIDLEVPLGHQLLQLSVLPLELPETLGVRDVHPPELLPPPEDRLLAHPVLPCRLGNRLVCGLRLSENPNDLLCLEAALSHRMPSHPAGILSHFTWSEIPWAAQGLSRSLLNIARVTAPTYSYSSAGSAGPVSGYPNDNAPTEAGACRECLSHLVWDLRAFEPAVLFA